MNCQAASLPSANRWFHCRPINGTVILGADAGSGQITGATATGQISFANGNLTGILDQNDFGTFTLNAPFTGTYTISPNGRATMTLQLDPQTVESKTVYLEDVSKGFVLDASGTVIDIGSFSLRPLAHST